MKCKDCTKWQGTRYSAWGDCHYIAHMLNPELDHVYKRDGFKLLPPLDPHDQKYVDQMPKYREITGYVRIQMQREEDVVYDAEGNERRKVVRLPFYQTHKECVCPSE